MAGSDPVLVCVEPARIDEIWPHVRRFTESAFSDGRGDDNAEIVEADLRAGYSLLWIVWTARENRILAAVTTKLLKTPRGFVCRITSCGGIELKRWAHLLADIEAYAKAEGCICVRWEGRKGWKAFFPGYREPWIVLEKKV